MLKYLRLKNLKYRIIFNRGIDKSKIDIKLLTKLFNLLVEYQDKIFTEDINYVLEIYNGATMFGIGIKRPDSNYLICYLSKFDNVIYIKNDSNYTESAYPRGTTIHDEKYKCI